MRRSVALLSRGLLGPRESRGWAQASLAKDFSSQAGGGGGGGGGSGDKVQPPQKNLLQRLADSVKQELVKDAKLREQMDKLKQASETLSNTEELQAAREKFKKVELESWKQTDVVKEKAEELMAGLRKAAAAAAESEMGKKALHASRDIADSVGKAAAAAGDTQAAKKVAQGMRVVSTELDSVAGAQMYKRPEELQTRAHFSSASPARVFEADTESTGVQVHKDARWYTGFKTWYDQSPTMEKFMDWKLKYDESDSRMARVARFFTDGIQSAVHSTTGTDVSQVLTEIAKVDPSFDKDEFCQFVQSVVVPNVMEAQVRGDLEVLGDWLHEVPFRQLSEPIKQQKEIGYDASASRVLDTGRVELITGKMMDQGPVFILSFYAHVIEVLKNRDGKVIQGNPDHVVKMNHVWALARDMAVLDPNAAWKVLEIHASPAPMAV